MATKAKTEPKDIFTALREAPGDPMKKRCAIRYLKADFAEMLSDESFSQAFHDLNCMATVLSFYGKRYAPFLNSQREILKEVHKIALVRRRNTELVTRLLRAIKSHLPPDAFNALRNYLENFC